MTFFLHIPEVQEGIQRAAEALNSVDEGAADQQKQELIARLEQMLAFAKTNLNEMLSLMGFSSMEELNAALQNYNNLNLSLQQLFPAFSAPQMTEVLAQSGIGTLTNDADYGLVVSALEDNIRKLYPEFLESGFVGEAFQSQLREKLANSDEQLRLASNVMAQLFGGIDLSLGEMYVNLTTGDVDVGQVINRLGTIINRSAHSKNVMGTSIRTLGPFYYNFLVPFFNSYINNEFDMFVNEHSYQIIEDALKRSQRNHFNREIIAERIRRGGITISSKIKNNISTSGDQVMVQSYLDTLTVNLPRDQFDISARGNKSIEKYVNDICAENSDIKKQIIENINKFYWKIIESHIPSTIQNPLTSEKFQDIITRMTEKEGGNIGWFFSQGGTKALGAGMFGEIAGMIYMSLLCPKLKDNASLLWAGGVIGDGSAKPPADILLSAATKKYGIQVKNYTSGSILSSDYALKIKNIMDEAADNNDDNKLDLMTLQATSELGISPQEIEAIQNIIVANTFNIPYIREGKLFVAGANGEFADTRGLLTRTYNMATRYMALISVIMHRLQYEEEVTRKISNVKAETQLQNTLWLINGNLFVSSVQILEELIQYVKDAVNKFFNVTASIKIKGDNLPEGLEAGNMTIVEYFNYSAKNLGKTALSKVSARIGTDYRMSAFNR